jgi:hypothetical protein
MQYDLTSLCQDARARIDVPSVPLRAIRKAARQRGTPLRRRTLFVVFAAALSLGAVAAAAVWHAMRVYVGSTGAVDIYYAHTMTIKQHATQADAVSAARRVDFPVILPTGLPAATRLQSVARVERSVLMLDYDLPGAWRRSHHLLAVTLADPAIVGTTKSAPANVRWMMLHYDQRRRTVRWRVGGEEVIIAWNNFTPAELARMKEAMLKASTQR